MDRLNDHHLLDVWTVSREGTILLAAKKLRIGLLQRWGSGSPLLTDEDAPVDLMMSSHFLRKSDH